MIYFIQTADNRFIKIGKADDPAKRIASIQTSLPQRIKLIATIPGGHEQEKALHHRFASLRTRGEWFHAAPQIIEFATYTSALDLADTDFTDKRMAKFFDLATWQPELLTLYTQAAAITDDGTEPWFCANTEFYGHHGRRGFKRPLSALVGWFAQDTPHICLTTEEAYDTAYQTIYEALPDCRDCQCA